MLWYVYILKCADTTLYTGITTDLHRRIYEHNYIQKKASKYVYTRRPAILVYQKQYQSKSDASKEEWRIKRLSREKKQALFTNKK